MKLSQFTTLLILGCLLQPVVSFAQKRHKIAGPHKIDLIIEVNSDLLIGDMPDLHLELNNGAGPKIDAQYIPGHLIVGNKDFMALDAAKEFTLCFDNYTYQSRKLFITKFKIKIVHSLLSEPYLVLSCYDFNNKQYRRWYENASNKEYAVDIVHPGSTLLAKNK
jgi:hypothetical protein